MRPRPETTPEGPSRSRSRAPEGNVRALQTSHLHPVPESDGRTRSDRARCEPENPNTRRSRRKVDSGRTCARGSDLLLSGDSAVGASMGNLNTPGEVQLLSTSRGPELMPSGLSAFPGVAFWKRGLAIWRQCRRVTSQSGVFPVLMWLPLPLFEYVILSLHALSPGKACAGTVVPALTYIVLGPYELIRRPPI